MAKMHLDGVDRKLISLLQAEFPFSREPYADIGLDLGIGHDDVIQRVEQLKAKGIVRQISPVLNARRIGYQPALVAMRVEAAELDKAERLIIEHPMVSHGYEREHHFNVWFTLAAKSGDDIQCELERLTGSIEAEAVFSLPAVKLFKIGAFFAVDGDGQTMADNIPQCGGALSGEVRLSGTDRLVINVLQQDLPLTRTPFSAMAQQLDMEEDYFLAACRSLKQRGIIRRFGAAINHRRAGFKANAMTCWIAPQDKVDAAGRVLAELKEVSHCYERKTNPLWPYNLFAMIHGHTREACQEVAAGVSAETGLNDCVLLFSTREFKKTRVKYLL